MVFCSDGLPSADEVIEFFARGTIIFLGPYPERHLSCVRANDKALGKVGDASNVAFVFLAFRF